MKVQQNNPVHKLNWLAIACLLAGILALIPYLPLAIHLLWLFEVHLVRKSNLGNLLARVGFFIPDQVYFLNGIIFGLISLIVGSISILRTNTNQGVKVSHRLAISGIVLGVVGMLSNVLYFGWLSLAIIAD